MQFAGEMVHFFEKGKNARTILQVSHISAVSPWEENGVVNGATIKTKTGLSMSVDMTMKEYESLCKAVIKKAGKAVSK